MKTKTIKKIFGIITKIMLGFIITFVALVAGARASVFGEENLVLSKILMEDIQQSFHLKDIMGFAKDEVKTLNQKYGYEKWINKGLDSVKDYGILKHIKTDDFILSTLQSDLGDVGLYINQDDYKMDNIEDWVDQVWGKAPEIVNVETEYPGSLSDWMFQSQNNLPGTYSGFSSLSHMVNRKDAIMSYKHAMWNIGFNEKLRGQLHELYGDAQESNPGEASRIIAQSSTLQNYQLAQINDTQSSLLRSITETQLNKMRDEDIKAVSAGNTFLGIRSLFKTIPTLGQ